jgi:hypothetical protein
MPSNRQNPSVIVIGAGMTGILVAIKLKEAGISNITVIEKKDSIGGTWRENTYPGIACDVPSHAYTYSFAPNPNWSSHVPHGAEIHQYFSNVFTRYGIDKLTRFNETVTRCAYGDDSQHGPCKPAKAIPSPPTWYFPPAVYYTTPSFPKSRAMTILPGLNSTPRSGITMSSLRVNALALSVRALPPARLSLNWSNWRAAMSLCSSARPSGR